MISNSVPVSQMIEILSKLNPNDRVAFTQDGYYADGKFATIADSIEDVDVIGKDDNTVIYPSYIQLVIHLKIIKGDKDEF